MLSWSNVIPEYYEAHELLLVRFKRCNAACDTGGQETLHRYRPILIFLELKSSKQRLEISLDSILSMVALKTALIRFHFSRLHTALRWKGLF